MLVQVFIILLGIVLGALILASRGSSGARASVKVGLILLLIAMVVAVLNPDLMTRIANIAGIGRGADLLLYGVTGAFVFYTLTQYLKSQSQRDVIYRLARRVALIEANQRYADVLVKRTRTTAVPDTDAEPATPAQGEGGEGTDQAAADGEQDQ